MEKRKVSRLDVTNTDSIARGPVTQWLKLLGYIPGRGDFEALHAWLMQLVRDTVEDARLGSVDPPDGRFMFHSGTARGFKLARRRQAEAFAEHVSGDPNVMAALSGEDVVDRVESIAAEVLE